MLELYREEEPTLQERLQKGNLDKDRVRKIGEEAKRLALIISQSGNQPGSPQQS